MASDVANLLFLDDGRMGPHNGALFFLSDVFLACALALSCLTVRSTVGVCGSVLLLSYFFGATPEWPIEGTLVAFTFAAYLIQWPPPPYSMSASGFPIY